MQVENARALLAMGFQPIPVPLKSKRAKITGWPDLILTNSTIGDYFGSERSNVGVLLGKPSGWLVDIDLDHPLALEFADQYLPQTGLVWGRSSKPLSHRIFHITAPADTKLWRIQNRVSIVEFRSTGAQTIAPGSIHPSGERIEWASMGQPRIIAPIELVKQCELLVERVKSRLPQAAKPTPTRPIAPINPIDPINPVDPIRSPVAEDMVERFRVKGPGEHDASTLLLARGLKFDSGVPDLESARPYFDAWWKASRVRCSDPDDDAAWFKFERAWRDARCPINAKGVAAQVLETIECAPDEPSGSQFGPKLRLLVNGLAEMGRRNSGAPFAISAKMVSEKFSVSMSTSQAWFTGLESLGIIRCVDRGRPGTNGSGRARRIVFVGCPQATNLVHSEHGENERCNKEGDQGK